MDESDREKEKRDVGGEKAEWHTFEEMQTMLPRSSSSGKKDESEALQSTTELCQEKEAATSDSTSQPESSQSCSKSASETPSTSRRRGRSSSRLPRGKSSWTPPFQSYEDFVQMTLQSLDGSLIILSTSGVIVFVAKSIFYLLGHLPCDIVGRTLLSLLPEGEKSKIYRKISLRLPLPNLVGEHIEFCCHMRKGNVEYGSGSNYEYVKIFLTVIDIANDPLVLFTSFFPSHCIESPLADLPLEDRFFLVGSICVLRSEMLQEIFAPEDTSGESTQERKKKAFSVSYRSRRQERRARVEALRMDLTASSDQDTSKDQGLLELQESADTFSMRSDVKSDSNSVCSVSSLETTSAWQAMPYMQPFDCATPELQYEEVHLPSQSPFHEYQLTSPEGPQFQEVVDPQEEAEPQEEQQLKKAENPEQEVGGQEAVKPEEEAQPQEDMQTEKWVQPPEEVQLQADIQPQGEIKLLREMQLLEEMQPQTVVQEQEEIKPKGEMQFQETMKAQQEMQLQGDMKPQEEINLPGESGQEMRRPPGIPAEMPLSITWSISACEKALMKQLEEYKSLQSGRKYRQGTYGEKKGQPSTSSGNENRDPMKLVPPHRRSRLGKMKRGFSSAWVAKRFCASSPRSFNPSEDSEEPCKSSTQQPVPAGGAHGTPSPKASQDPPAKMSEEASKSSHSSEGEENEPRTKP